VTGIDYTRLLDATHQAELAARVNYAALTEPTGSGQEAERDLDQPQLGFDSDGQARS
jgi:hypothetical protein